MITRGAAHKWQQVIWGQALEAAGDLGQKAPASAPGDTLASAIYKVPDMRSCGREAEGGGLLNRYTVEKPYRGFESLRLRHFPVFRLFVVVRQRLRF